MLLCKNPIVLVGRAFGCGQCMPCRTNKRRIWSHRIMLEAKQYKDNAFVTLSYADDMLPHDGSVVPKHLQAWLKRLRAAYPRRLRFFAVGEYGEVGARPHYHVALFNYPPCEKGQSTYGFTKNCCKWCDLIRDTWRKGNIFVGSLEERSAAYICGYVTKKMTFAGDPRLEGRHPEFARMSLRPGIGGDAMFEVADVLMKFRLDETEPDVPGGLRHGKFILPLGRYLQRRVRKMVGKDEKTPEVVLQEIDKKMLPLRLAARGSEENPGLSSRVLDLNRGKIASFEARERVRKQRRVL